MGHVLNADEIAASVREVTDDEVAFYQEHGWVKLDALIAPEFAAELLRVGEDWHQREHKSTRDWNSLALHADAEPYRSLMFSDRMGRNAQRLVNRERLSGTGIALRYRNDHFVARPPETRGTAYHQDSTEHGSDRAGELQFWLALAEVTPEMGAMRFVTGSHQEGPLGAVMNGSPDLLEQYPGLTDVYELSPPFHYRPGDATAHHGYTVHGAPPNTTDRQRLSYIFSYTPADTRWWNGRVENWGSKRLPLEDGLNPMINPTR
ncbi:MAG TPA: phytanoyl-CoA dioxygenase family protein [Candidatus Dormibacteraeota bacterium]|nr:phytanoyl-CoA dioxygenase family protein [Candidatus Dormibacteraeota bacterium]